MLKNKTIFKSIAVALIMFMMVAALSPSVGTVYAEGTSEPVSGIDGNTGSTNVEYTVDQTGWTFSVPAAQTFTKGNLTLYGNVSISPESGKDIISLPSGQTINMTFTAANFNNGVFELRNGSNSVIPYKIGEVTRIASEGVSEEVSDITSDGCTVLTYIAGSSSNEGVTNKLRFATTLENIKNAKVTGLHTDTLTFTVNVTGGTSGGGSESGGSTTPTTSTFYIDDKEYEFEEGMTWGDWSQSQYNTLVIHNDGDEWGENNTDWAGKIICIPIDIFNATHPNNTYSGHLITTEDGSSSKDKLCNYDDKIDENTQYYTIYVNNI